MINVIYLDKDFKEVPREEATLAIVSDTGEDEDAVVYSTLVQYQKEMGDLAAETTEPSGE